MVRMERDFFTWLPCSAHTGGSFGACIIILDLPPIQTHILSYSIAGFRLVVISLSLVGHTQCITEDNEYGKEPPTIKGNAHNKRKRKSVPHSGARWKENLE